MLRGWLPSGPSMRTYLSGLTFIQILMDLVKAFDTVPHQQLIDAARERGYPLWLLRLSLAIYRMPRVIMIERKCSRLILASRGITAGSTFATSELMALLIGLVDLLNERWSGIVSCSRSNVERNTARSTGEDLKKQCHF